MNLGEKIQTLRKQKNLSQEALAQELNVSRQAVSKWETNEGYPEMDKLILLSELFEVSMDYLVKESDEQYENNHSQKYFMNKQRIEEYIHFKKQFSMRIALGVTMIILAFNFPLYFSDTQNEIVGNAIFLLIVGLAIMVLITTGLSHEKYNELEHQEINISYNELQNLQNEYMHFRSKFGMAIALGVFIIIFSFIGTMFLEEYMNAGLSSGIFFITCISVASWIFINQGIRDDMYKFLTQNKKFIEDKHQEKKKNHLYGITMPLATMVYLVMGFTMNWWHPAWVIFPITIFLTEGIQHFINKE